MELIMAAQEDATPWDTPDSARPAEATQDSNRHAMPGRAYFSQLGVVRRKPARSDALPSLSKSCSDKIALKQCTSLLSAVASLLVSPRSLYLSTLVLPKTRFSPSACRRAFSPEGRLRPMAGRRWNDDYAFRPFSVETCTRAFQFCQHAVAARSKSVAASNVAVAWSRNGLDEVLIGGSRQGRRQFHAKGASKVSRHSMWRLVHGIASQLSSWPSAAAVEAQSYRDMKMGEALRVRRQVKQEVYNEALKGWLSNTGDDTFGL